MTTTTAPAPTTAPPTAPSNPPAGISPTKITTALNNASAAAAIMQIYTNVVLRTPIMSLPSDVDTLSKSNVATQLPTDQKTAQAHASYYLETLNPNMAALLTDAVGFANEWNGYYDTLLGLAKNIADDGNLANFTDGINRLITASTKCQTNAAALQTSLATFAATDLSADTAAFKTDFTNINAAYGADSSAIQALQHEITSDNSAMTDANWEMGTSGVLAIAGVVMIGIGACGELESAGTSSVLIVGGLALLGTAGTVGSLGLANYVQASQNLAAATVQLNQDEAVLTATQQAMINVENLAASCSKAATSVGGLATQWGYLSGDLNNLIGALNNVSGDLASASMWLTSDLQTANSDMQDVLNQATSLEANSILTVGSTQTITPAQAQTNG